MSNEEQLLAIGKMSTERADKKRERALLLRQIQDAGGSFNKAAPLLMRQTPEVSDYQNALQILGALQQSGGLDHIRQALSEYLELTERINNLSISLRDAGVE
jgi:hypothetical protein